MQIRKVLNSSVVLVRDDAGEESILLGKGIGYGRKARRVQREVVLCIDQSGSMAESIVYSGIYGAVMASLPAVATRIVFFDTAVVDMTDSCADPVDILFGVQLGGGTDINRAVSYCRQCIREPRNTIFVLISDLYEGGVERELLQQAAEMKESVDKLAFVIPKRTFSYNAGRLPAAMALSFSSNISERSTCSSRMNFVSPGSVIFTRRNI